MSKLNFSSHNDEKVVSEVTWPTVGSVRRHFGSKYKHFRSRTNYIWKWSSSSCDYEKVKLELTWLKIGIWGHLGSKPENFPAHKYDIKKLSSWSHESILEKLDAVANFIIRKLYVIFLFSATLPKTNRRGQGWVAGASHFRARFPTGPQLRPARNSQASPRRPNKTHGTKGNIY